jgi:hypothetical protein
MIGSGWFHFLGCWAMPVASLTFTLLTCHALIQGKWQRVLPWFSTAIAGITISSLVVFLLFLLQEYSAQRHQLFCTLYSRADFFTGAVVSWLVMAAVLEILDFMLRPSAKAQKVVRIIEWALIGLMGSATVLVAISQSSWSDGFDRTAAAAIRSAVLIIFIMFVVFLVLMGSRSRALPTSMFIIQCALAGAYILDLALAFVQYQHPAHQMVSLIRQSLGVCSYGIILMAVRKGSIDSFTPQPQFAG